MIYSDSGQLSKLPLWFVHG